MTFHNEGEALAALMSGGASPEDLREIVTGYPHLRAAVTLYPATDTALLGWLSATPQSLKHSPPDNDPNHRNQRPHPHPHQRANMCRPLSSAGVAANSYRRSSQ